MDMVGCRLSWVVVSRWKRGRTCGKNGQMGYREWAGGRARTYITRGARKKKIRSVPSEDEKGKRGLVCICAYSNAD